MNQRRRSPSAALLAVLLCGAAFAEAPVPVAAAADISAVPVAGTAPGSNPSAANPSTATPPASTAPASTPAANIPSDTAQGTGSQAAAAAPVRSGAALPGAGRPAAPVVGASTSGMVSGLVFLLVLVLGAAWLVKRSGGMPALRGGPGLKIVAALSLGPRERVVLIEAGGQQWLLGVGGGAVNLLHHFEQPIAVAGGDDFAGKLRQFLPQGSVR